jgi:hypothetical protein
MTMAKTFYRSSLPEVIRYNKGVYLKNSELTEEMRKHPTLLGLRPGSRPYVIVYVLNRRLRGKIDFHGKPYEPTMHIYSKQKEAANG